MKKEYTEKMNSYQDDEYEKFLKDKCVLDAKQYLHSSMLYLHYGITSIKLKNQCKNPPVLWVVGIYRKITSKMREALDEVVLLVVSEIFANARICTIFWTVARLNYLISNICKVS